MTFLLFIVLMATGVVGATVATWWPVLSLERRLLLGPGRSPATPRGLDAVPSEAKKKEPEAGGDERALVSPESELAQLMEPVQRRRDAIPATALKLGIPGTLMVVSPFLMTSGQPPGALLMLGQVTGLLLLILAGQLPLVYLYASWVLRRGHRAGTVDPCDESSSA